MTKAGNLTSPISHISHSTWISFAPDPRRSAVTRPQLILIFRPFRQYQVAALPKAKLKDFTRRTARSPMVTKVRLRKQNNFFSKRRKSFWMPKTFSIEHRMTLESTMWTISPRSLRMTIPTLLRKTGSITSLPIVVHSFIWLTWAFLISSWPTKRSHVRRLPTFRSKHT